VSAELGLLLVWASRRVLPDPAGWRCARGDRQRKLVLDAGCGVQPWLRVGVGAGRSWSSATVALSWLNPATLAWLEVADGRDRRGRAR